MLHYSESYELLRNDFDKILSYILHICKVYPCYEYICDLSNDLVFWIFCHKHHKEMVAHRYESSHGS